MNTDRDYTKNEIHQASANWHEQVMREREGGGGGRAPLGGQRLYSRAERLIAVTDERWTAHLLFFSESCLSEISVRVFCGRATSRGTRFLPPAVALFAS